MRKTRLRRESKNSEPSTGVRRSTALGNSAVTKTTMTYVRRSHGLESRKSPKLRSQDSPVAAERRATRGFRIDNDREGIQAHAGAHKGKGSIDIKCFNFDGAPKPAVLLIYTIPPGACEGVHVHRPGDIKLGSFDEFYYILAGSGEMRIADERIPVSAGDHVFTPNGIPHGIENTSAEGNLKIYLIAMIRE